LPRRRRARRDVDVVWVPGAFELPSPPRRPPRRDAIAAWCALGAVIRGETPHFEYVAGETTRGLGEIALRHRLPIGFGLLTVDTLQQATERAGGSAGNKGYEAAEAALLAADAVAHLGGGDAAD
jgi:6,7-dimethyl-8-ribityllumazine synthase